MDTMQLYIRNTLQKFDLLGPVWQGGRLPIRFGDGAVRQVEGWTGIFTGRRCEVHVVKARWLAQPGGPERPVVGYLVWGGDSGLRVLDQEPEGTEYLPPGYGRVFIWIEDPADLPGEVLQVIDPAAWAVKTM